MSLPSVIKLDEDKSENIESLYIYASLAAIDIEVNSSASLFLKLLAESHALNTHSKSEVQALSQRLEAEQILSTEDYMQLAVFYEAHLCKYSHKIMQIKTFAWCDSTLLDKCKSLMKSLFGQQSVQFLPTFTR